MFIDKKWISVFPHLKNEFLKLDEFMDKLQNMRRSKISLKGKEGITRDGQILLLYIQYVLNRSVDLVESIFNGWNNEKPVISLILCRTLQENVAVAYDISSKINNYIDENKYGDITELIKNRTWGGRDIKDMPRITNFMTAIDKTEKSFQGFIQTYNLLSEFAHPNYLGMGNMYGDLNKPNMEYTITHNKGLSETTLQLILSSVIPALVILELSLSEMEMQGNKLISL